MNYCNKLLVLQYIKSNHLIVHHNYLHDLRMFYCGTCFIISFSPNQHLFTHREPFRWFYTLSIFLSQGVKFFLQVPDEMGEGKHGEETRQKYPINSGNWYKLCHSTMQSPFPSKHLLSPRSAFHLVQQVVESCALCFPIHHYRPLWAVRIEKLSNFALAKKWPQKSP